MHSPPFPSLRRVISHPFHVQYVVAVEAIKNIAGLSFISQEVLQAYRDFHIRRFTEEYAAVDSASGPDAADE